MMFCKKEFFFGMAIGLTVGAAITCMCEKSGGLMSKMPIKTKAGKTVKRIVKAIDDIM